MLIFNKVFHLAAVNALYIGVKYRLLSALKIQPLKATFFYKDFTLDNPYSGQL
jgi:hypothetical protein